MFFFPVLFAAMKHQDDGDLAQRLKNRDQQAMADLYDRYGRVAYVLIFRIVRNSGVAEDLVQETFLRVWNRSHLLDEVKGALGPWVLTVARNRAIDYLRSLEGRSTQNSVQLDGTEHPTLFRNLESEILNSDRARRLKEAFRKLSAHQQQVIELAYYEGLSQSEMAERLKQPLGTVKTWVRSALRVLREELGEAVMI
jgi:RNA polymerase sigma-70 factor (ECF subfamily)